METNKNLKPDEFPAIIIGKLMNISGILNKESNRMLLPYELNHQQFSILFEIVKAKSVQQKNMVNRMHLEKAHVSKVVKKLQSMNLIEVIPLANDKRSATLSVNKKGQQLVDECRAMFQKWNQEWFGEMTESEMQQLLNSLQRLQTTFNANHEQNSR